VHPLGCPLSSCYFKSILEKYGTIPSSGEEWASGPAADGLQRQARSLGDPTRHRIFRHIPEARRSIDVAELTALLGLNHNAVRQHLAVLEDAELVIEEIEQRRRPGRPRLLYRLNPGAAGSWGTEGPYCSSPSLSEVVRTHASPRQVGRDEGRRRAHQAPGRDSGTLGTLEEDMVTEGFHPVPIPHPRGCDFVLGRCRFDEVARRDPATVCELHLGLAEGAAAVLDEGVSVSLVAKDPQQAGCRVWIRLPLGAETTSA
jgi:predicted ArsR family transcriptional regulator